MSSSLKYLEVAKQKEVAGIRSGLWARAIPNAAPCLISFHTPDAARGRVTLLSPFYRQRH